MVRIGVVLDECGAPGAQRSVDKDLDAADGEEEIVRAFHAALEKRGGLGNGDGGVNPVGHEPIAVDRLHQIDEAIGHARILRLGPAQGRIGLHALDEVVAKVVVGIVGDDGPEGVYGPGEHIARGFAVVIALEATALGVRGVPSNPREFQRPAIHEG